MQSIFSAVSEIVYWVHGQLVLSLPLYPPTSQIAVNIHACPDWFDNV